MPSYDQNNIDQSVARFVDITSGPLRGMLSSNNNVENIKAIFRHTDSTSEAVVNGAALESVDGVCIFAEATATRFLDAAEPDVYVKGGDYTLDTLNKAERQAVEGTGGRIVIIPFVPGKSTTSTMQKIARL